VQRENAVVRIERAVPLLRALVQRAERQEGRRAVGRRRRGGEVLAFSRREVLLALEDHPGRDVSAERAHLGDLGGVLPRVAHAAASDARRDRVELHQPVARGDVAWVELHCTLERALGAAREHRLPEPARVARLQAECDPEPCVVIRDTTVRLDRALEESHGVLRAVLDDGDTAEVIGRGRAAGLPAGRRQRGFGRGVLATLEEHDPLTRVATLRTHGGRCDGQGQRDARQQRTDHLPATTCSTTHEHEYPLDP
jgi:hypothetical protein